MTRHSLAIASAALLAACGGSSSTAPAPAAPGSPASTATALRGVVTASAAGTLTVTGQALSTAGASFQVEKQSAAETEIHRGMVVRVKGTRDASGHHVSQVEFEDHLQGRSGGNVAAGDSSLQVGGRTVHIEDSTHVMDDHGNDLTPGDIHQDDRVRVSGFADDQGRLHATSLERRAQASSDDSFEAKGFVIAIAADRKSLDLSLTPGGALAWHVTLASGTVAAGISVGSYVEVHAPAAAAGTDVTATTVTLDDHGMGEAGAETEVEGIVTSGTSASFEVDGQVVLTSGSTRWENGTAVDLVPGVKVEAEGQLDGSGNLVAEKVSFRDSARLQGVVAGTAGAFTVLGFPLTLTGTADGSGLLAAGAFVEVRGYPRASGSGLVVTRVKAVNSGNPKSFVQGPVTAVDGGAGTVQMLGITVVAAAGASYSDHEQVSLSRADFFAKVVAGRSVVKARVDGAPAGTPPSATSGELELEDEPASHP